MKSYLIKPGEAIEQSGEITKVFRDKNTIYHNIRCDFDTIGNLIYKNITTPKIFGFNENTNLIFTYKYDNLGNRIEKNCYGSNGGLISKYTYEYDEKGNRLEENVYDTDGKLEDKYTFKYDKKGNQIEVEEIWYDSNGNSDMLKYTYKFDKRGNKIKS